MQFPYTWKEQGDSCITQVGIIGAGPAGLLLGQMLHLQEIDSVILETCDQDYVIDRVRAGVLEQFTADFMDAMSVGERLHKEGMRHDDVYVSFGGKRHLIPLAELTGGKAIFVYGQNEVVKDLMNARLATGRPLDYEVSNISVHDIDTEKPRILYHHNGSDQELTCDFIAGCDGFHGICRPALASGLGDAAKFYDCTYPCGCAGLHLP
jgi:p-hydroxybenzoate 3-monooxygenase